MYIDGFKKNDDRDDRKEKEEKIKNFYTRKEKNDMIRDEETVTAAEPVRTESALARWQAPEFETYERDRRWEMYLALVLAAIVAYAVFTNSPIMAITFILIGVVAYIYMNKEARILDFMVTSDGVVAGKELYPFENIKSFWIFYEPDGKKVISLHTRSYLPPYVHIPIHEEDPVELREILLQYVPEIKQEEGVIDTLERLLRI